MYNTSSQYLFDICMGVEIRCPLLQDLGRCTTLITLENVTGFLLWLSRSKIQAPWMRYRRGSAEASLYAEMMLDRMSWLDVRFFFFYYYFVLSFAFWVLRFAVVIMLLANDIDIHFVLNLSLWDYHHVAGSRSTVCCQDSRSVWASSKQPPARSSLSSFKPAKVCACKYRFYFYTAFA